MPTSAINQWLAASLSEHYRLNGIARLSPLVYPTIENREPEPESRFWRVDTDDEQLILKRYKRGKTPARIHFEEEFQTRMHAADPELVPQLLTTTRGDKHFVLGSDQSWRLERYFDSRHYKWWQCDWQPEQCAEAGRFLSRFHRTSRAVTKRWQSQTYDTAFDTIDLAPLTGNDLEETMRKALTSCADHPPAIRDFQRLLNDCRSLLRQSKPHLHAHTRGNQDELLLIHGDFHMGNLLFSGAQIRGIVDYEDVRLQTRLYELGYAALMLCFPWTVEPGQDPLGLDQKFFSRFFQSYSETGALTPDLPKHSIVTACILIIAWLLERSQDWSEPDSTSYRCCKRLIQAWRFYV
ncbi:MAG TPA: aminoglycoside phosphotransferase family protein [Planktothrix sp.]|jgi:Ser/Thr protein kinase RdoA (MazF antagonist)